MSRESSDRLSHHSRYTRGRKASRATAFFPATLTNDDPVVADELSLPMDAGLAGALRIAADALHLPAAAAWLGGLVPVYSVLHRCLGGSQEVGTTVHCLMRFSAMGWGRRRHADRERSAECVAARGRSSVGEGGRRKWVDEDRDICYGITL